MLTWGQAIFLALLQGISELFPVSSLGHSVILPAIFGWGELERNEAFVPFVVLLHLGTAAALALFYWQDWVRVVRAFAISAVRGRLMHTPDEHLAWMLFFGTIPAGVLGAVFENPLKTLFATPLIASALLVVNGGIMLLGERLRRGQDKAGALTFRAEEPEGKRSIADLSWRDAVAVGSAQALALFPGISRSGVTMCAGLLINMRHDEAARYTFMLATPLIAAAGLLEVPTLFAHGAPALAVYLVGGVLSGVTAYLSVRFLTRYFRFGRLDPFAYYCVAVGLLSFAIFGARGGS